MDDTPEDRDVPEEGDAPSRNRVHRTVDTSAGEPAALIAEIVADIEEMEPTELPNMWACTDGVLDHLFSNPPSAEAQMEVTFSYEGYRITIEQDGTAEFVRVE